MTSDTYVAIGVCGLAFCGCALFVFANRCKNHEACQCEETPLTTDDMKRIEPTLPEPLLRQYGAFLDTLRIVESNGDDKAIGKSGERGAYQMTRRAWDDASDWYSHRGMEVTPWETGAHDPKIARAYAAIYLHGLAVRYIEQHGMAPSPQMLFALWNCGYSGCSKFGFNLDNAPSMVQRKAERFKGVRL